MATTRFGVSAAGGDASMVLSRIVELDRLGIQAAWLTTGGAGLDGLTVLAAAAARTEQIKLGTSIIPTWPRHPIVVVQQTQVIARLAPGRFRLGLGPSHKPTIESTFGFEFDAPLAHLSEYVHIVRTLLREGSIDFDGKHYKAHTRITAPITDVPVMASALRRGSFQFCGATTDGAISWVCPPEYLRAVAIPAMTEGAQTARRPIPPLIAHVPVCVHERAGEVRTAVREQLAGYPRLPFYARMFADAGFPEARESAGWSDRMIDAVVAHGDEAAVAERLRQVLAWGAAEALIAVVTAGTDANASWERTMRLIAVLSQGG
ncbi:MAG: LLM class flavin-dependent oxidoreductase [Chloroflexi bacterium]|nr:LLM class flavin-dependent oxidoreductase [Chloroflexota bacterium]